MVQKRGRKKLFVAIAAIGALVLIIAVVAIVKSMSQPEPAVSNDTTQKDTPSISDEANNTEKPATTEPEKVTSESAIDAANTSSVTIEPMSITVSYVKGIDGFDYEVLRTGSGTKYVQFSSAKLAGTKCTDDIGEFASIIEKPSADEATTLAKTTTVDGTDYGLSLAESTCTSDAALLQQYQKAFSEAFSLLKKM